MSTTGMAGRSDAAGQWYAVRERAGDRCECTGECGSRHKNGGGRCARESTWPDPARVLSVVPADPAVSLAAAAALPWAELRLRCTECVVGSRRQMERVAAAHHADDQVTLWGAA